MVSAYWLYVAVFGITLAAVLLFFLGWRRRELRRARAMDALKKIAPWDLAYLPDILAAYATGNYFGRDSVTRKIHELIDDLQAGGLDRMLIRVAWKVIEHHFVKNEPDRQKLADLLAGKPVPKVDAPMPPLTT